MGRFLYSTIMLLLTTVVAIESVSSDGKKLPSSSTPLSPTTTLTNKENDGAVSTSTVAKAAAAATTILADFSKNNNNKTSGSNVSDVNGVDENKWNKLFNLILNLTSSSPSTPLSTPTTTISDTATTTTTTNIPKSSVNNITTENKTTTIKTTPIVNTTPSTSFFSRISSWFTPTTTTKITDTPSTTPTTTSSSSSITPTPHPTTIVTTTVDKESTTTQPPPPPIIEVDDDKDYYNHQVNSSTKEEEKFVVVEGEEDKENTSIHHNNTTTITNLTDSKVEIDGIILESNETLSNNDSVVDDGAANATTPSLPIATTTDSQITINNMTMYNIDYNIKSTMAAQTTSYAINRGGGESSTGGVDDGGAGNFWSVFMKIFNVYKNEIFKNDRSFINKNQTKEWIQFDSEFPCEKKLKRRYDYNTLVNSGVDKRTNYLCQRTNRDKFVKEEKYNFDIVYVFIERLSLEYYALKYCAPLYGKRDTFTSGQENSGDSDPELEAEMDDFVETNVFARPKNFKNRMKLHQEVIEFTQSFKECILDGKTRVKLYTYADINMDNSQIVFCQSDERICIQDAVVKDGPRYRIPLSEVSKKRDLYSYIAIKGDRMITHLHMPVTCNFYYDDPSSTTTAASTTTSEDAKESPSSILSTISLFSTTTSNNEGGARFVENPPTAIPVKPSSSSSEEKRERTYSSKFARMIFSTLPDTQDWCFTKSPRITLDGAVVVIDTKQLNDTIFYMSVFIFYTLIMLTVLIILYPIMFYLLYRKSTLKQCTFKNLINVPPSFLSRGGRNRGDEEDTADIVELQPLERPKFYNSNLKVVLNKM